MVAMGNKSLIAAITSSLFLISLLAAMQAVEVANANPFSFFYQTVEPIPGSVAPQITMINPQNNTLYNSNIAISFNVSKPITPKGECSIMYIGYDLDNNTKDFSVEFSDWLKNRGNYTYTSPQQFIFSQNFNLSEGNHSLVVHSTTAFLPGSMTVYYLHSSSTVSFMVDTTSPSISNISIENKTYTTTEIPLDFNVNETTSWLGYSIDIQANTTVTGNSTLTGLMDGSHSLVVYANDTAGNMGVSDIINFTVDTTPPTITIISPQNTSHYPPIPLIVNVNEPTSWIGYCLDNQANITITGNTTLTGLADGSHSLVVYANDTAGNIGMAISNFSVDTIAPIISNVTSDWQADKPKENHFTFSLNEAASLITYSIDQQAKVTITGNFTLANLSYGTHNLTLYVTDLAGNTATKTVSFDAREPFPTGWAVGIAATAIISIGLLVYLKKYHRKK